MSKMSPRDLVCADCWDAIFSTPAFREFGIINGQEQRIIYQSSLGQMALKACSWCSLIRLLKPSADDIVPKDEHPPGDEINIMFGHIPSSMMTGVFTPAGANRFALWINGAAFYLSAFTRLADPAASCVTARELDHIVFSRKATSQISQWLSDCSQHPDCPQREAKPLPTRVIDVGEERNSSVRLLETGHSLGEYVALSYCWGSDQPGKTIRSNLNGRLTNLDERILSKTIQDALKVTRALNMRYLWVDAICILQDSDQDKNHELANMCNIYRNSAVTVFATSASNSQEGFLHPRKPPNPATLIPFWNVDGELGTVSLRMEGWYDDDEEPINRRGWTFQERFLSPRSLFYASHTLQYQCQRGTVNLGGSINIPASFGDLRLPSTCSDLRLQPKSEATDMQELGRMWAYIVSGYSARKLSNIEDKLTAFAGVAEALEPLFLGLYISGLWTGETLPRTLLWQASATEPYIPCPDYTAPSWSWASLNSPIRFSSMYMDHTHEWYHTDILELHNALVEDSLPYGRVSGGSLTLRVHIRQGEFLSGHHIRWTHHVASAGGTSSSASATLDQRVFGCEIVCAATTMRTHILVDSDSMASKTAALAFPPKTRRSGQRAVAIDGLILKPDTDGSGRYTRIGCFRGADESEFVGCPRQTVVLF